MTRAAALLVCLPLSSCALTNWLWSGRDSGPIETPMSVELTTENIRGQIDGAPTDRIIALHFVANEDSPAQLARYTAERPATLVLEPDWAPDKPGLENDDHSPYHTDVLDINVDDTARLAGLVRATVRIGGRIAPAELGEILPPDRIPAPIDDAMPSDATMVEPSAAKAVEGLFDHDWLALLLPKREDDNLESVPGGLSAQLLSGEPDKQVVGWLDQDGELISTMQLSTRLRTTDDPNAELARHSLIAELAEPDGTRHVVRLPAPLLKYSVSKTLERVGDDVFWRYDHLWVGRYDRDEPRYAALEPLEIPVVGVGYHWEETEEPSTLVGDVVRVILTPVTVVLDIVVTTNPYLKNLVEWMMPAKAKLPTTRRGQ